MTQHHMAIAMVLFGLSAPVTALAHGNETHAAKPAGALSSEEHPWGREGDPKSVSRTIAVDMADTMRFNPSQITVKQGETVKFVVANSGKVLHEMVIGTEEELRKHAETMKKFPEMEHDAPYMAHVQPGGRQEIVWTFSRPGTFMYGCLIPGHWEAGMKGSVAVAAEVGMTSGEVRKVDKEAKKITLKHEAIVNLDMPPMTMVFVLQRPELLGEVKVGDKVRFNAEKVGGAFTVTQIEVAK
jgi:uncharacterized cupredoxin-like copper-binding protein